MKIAIMTFHAAYNHGAVLQAYALQTHLLKLGHSPYFVNYRHGKNLPQGIKGWVGSSLGKTLHKIGRKLRAKPFVNFQKKYLIIGEKYYSDHTQLQKDPPNADVYISGSDQVWNPNQIHLDKDEHAYWLDFGGSSVKRISYAASFGATSLREPVLSKYSQYAQRFDAVSVREKDAINLLNEFNITDGKWVPDPTLLLDQAEYKQVEKESREEPPFLFSYLIESEKAPLAVAARIKDCVREELQIALNYESLIISLMGNIFHRRYIGPGKWLSKLRQSQFVVTNSYHAVVFSIIFHKPFIVLLRSGIGADVNSRIESLLRYFELENRAVTVFDQNSIENLCREKIHWRSIDEKVRIFREVGFNFLSSCLREHGKP